jgi:sec-independent protein translocase protein TatC
MARNRDLFDDTTMTFGEHLEVLRVHVWKSLVGIAVGIVLSMFVGDRIIGVLKAPIDRALRDANIEDVEDDLKEVSLIDYFKSLFAGEEPQQNTPTIEPMETTAADTINVQVEVSDLVHALREVAPNLLAEPAPNTQQPTEANDTTSEDTTSVHLPLRSPEFAVLKKAADRFNTPVTFRVEEAFMTYLKVTVVAGIMLASPWVFYQLWQFVAAGLYQHERKYVHIYLPMSIGLFATGAVFCFYFVFPLVLSFLIGFSQWLGVELQPRLSEYISLVLMMPMMFGISFQLPLVMLFLERIGVCTVQTYTDNWRMSVLVMSITSMLLTPSDPGSMLLMLAPLIVLYVGGIQLCRMRPRAEPDPLA